MNRPRFSIVIPMYNKGDLIGRALASIFKQTEQDFEIVVVDDGSSDGSAAKVMESADERIRLIRQENGGVSAARNRGISKARAELIAFLDADDEWHPHFLETIARLVQKHPECGVYATRYTKSHVGRVGDTPARIRGLAGDHEGLLFDYFKVATRSDPPIHSSAVCIRRDRLEAIGGFPVGVAAGEDLLTWARLAAGGNIAYSMKVGSIFHQDPTASGSGRPTRVPATLDRVGDGLVALLSQVPTEKRQGLKSYIGFWHKMRTSCFVRLGMRRAAMKEMIKGCRYGIHWQYVVFGMCLVLPASLLPKIHVWRHGSCGRKGSGQ